MKRSVWLWLFCLALLSGLSGCAAPMEPISAEEKLFQKSLADATTSVFTHMQTIESALQRYRTEHGDWPSMHNPLNALVEQGYLASLPKPVEPVFWSHGKPGAYYFDTKFDKMDSGSTSDVVITSGYYSDQFCNAFIADHASNGGNLRAEIFDYELNGNTYPGKSLGRDAIVYGIKYNTADVDRCEIHWVMEYKP